jgi:predicted Zn-dependent protease
MNNYVISFHKAARLFTLRLLTLRRLTLLAALACTAITTAQAGLLDNIDINQLQKVGQQLAQSTEKSADEEMTIGYHMAATLVGAVRLDRNEKTQQYINRVGRWVSLHSTRPELEWQFGVLEDNDVNAFAAPGGYVFVTRGLLQLLDSEAELAGVLAHEIQHVNHKHHLKAVQKNNLLGAAADVGVLLGGSQLSSNQQRELGERAVNASKQLYARGLDKSDEYEADRDALTLMSNAGYDPYAFVAVMQKLDARSANDNGLALLLQTHPKPADRLLAMDKFMSSMKISAPLATLESRFKQVLR